MPGITEGTAIKFFSSAPKTAKVAVAGALTLALVGGAVVAGGAGAAGVAAAATALTSTVTDIAADRRIDLATGADRPGYRQGTLTSSPTASPRPGA